jgi:hypothetical protein
VSQTIRPGDVLADRYRLIDLLSESGDGRFFRAHDKILDRHVALHIIAADDPRAEELTEAARVSATVQDPHLLRVLDIETRDDRCFVVNEWGAGTSLDILVAGEGPLRPRRAAWIVAEAADCLSRAHPQRIAHGRLIPEHVLLDTAGAVRLIGFCVDAALAGLPAGRVSQDVTDLGGLLYYLLTGKWAGESASACPSAPRAAGRVLRPRQVRAGIPRELDRLCDQVLNPYSAGPGDTEHNLHTAAGIAQALREYVGDPAGLAEPAPVGGVRGAGALAVPMSQPFHAQAPEQAAEDLPAESEPTTVLGPAASEAPGAQQTQVVAAEEAAIGPQPVAEAPTQAGVPVFHEDDDVSWLERRADPPPPPEFEDPPERPLFAPEPPAGEPARRSRPGGSAGPTGGPGGYWPWESSTSGISSSSSGVIPVYEEPTTQQGRPWLRIAGLIAAALLLLVAMVIAYNLGRGKTALGQDPGPTRTSDGASPSAAPTPISGVRADDFDPQGDGGTENPELAPLAVDGDAGTNWHTSTYKQQLGPAGLKTGVGLVLDLGASHDVSGLRLTLVGQPSKLSVYTSQTPVDSVEGLTPVDRFTAQAKIDRTFDSPTKARYVVLWFTALPQVPGGFAGGVAEAVVLE